MSWRTRLASGTRAAGSPGPARLGNTPVGGLGNALPISRKQGSNNVKATVSSSYTTPGQPMYKDWRPETGVGDYLGHIWVMRCVRTKADTIAGLPFRVGPNPDNPSVTTPDAPLARLLGPSTPQQPGGPNPTTTARALWAWSKIQYDLTGVMAWNLIRSQAGGPIEMVYPMVSAAVDAIPTCPRIVQGQLQAGSTDWWESFVYHTPLGDLPMTTDEVFYAWRPGPKDWRQPESVMQAAQMPIAIARACDRYMWGILSRGMVSPKMIIAPPFDVDEDQRAWEDQFMSEYTGYDNAGKPIFAYAENETGETGNPVQNANVQVVDLAMKSVDAQLLEMAQMYRTDICLATGVPESLIGNASQRIYANADSEYRNFWTISVVPDITDFQDQVNVNLAPQLSSDVGWFDLSRVVALQPPTIFQPPAITDAITAGIITTQQASDLLGIPNAGATGEDVETAPLGEESASTGAGAAGGRSLRLRGQGSPVVELPDGWGFRYRPLTTYTLDRGNAGWGIVKVDRPRIRVNTGRRATTRCSVEPPKLANDVLSTVTAIRERREGQRMAQDDLERFGDWLAEAL